MGAETACRQQTRLQAAGMVLRAGSICCFQCLSIPRPRLHANGLLQCDSLIQGVKRRCRLGREGHEGREVSRVRGDEDEDDETQQNLACGGEDSEAGQ